MIHIIIDIRESTLYDNCIRLMNETIPNIKVTLQTLHLGDIVIEDDAGNTLVLYERKTLSDLVSSIKDGRYVEQSHRLIHSANVHPHNISYIIEGMYSQFRNNTDKQMCISAITTLYYFKGFSVFRTCSCIETSELIIGMAKKLQKELAAGKTARYSQKKESQNNPIPEINNSTINATLEKSSFENIQVGNETSIVIDDTIHTMPNIEVTNQLSANSYSEVVHKVKKNNITPENIGEIILCSIPGISSVSAIEIMKHYSSFAIFMEELKSNPTKLDEIYLTNNGKRRKLAKNIIDNIKRFLA